MPAKHPFRIHVEQKSVHAECMRDVTMQAMRRNAFFLLTRFVFSSLPPHIVHFSSIRSYISEILSTPYAGCYYCC